MQQGNALTLVLVGVAVALLAAMGVLVYLAQKAPQPIVPVARNASSENTVAEPAPDPRAGWRSYHDEDYSFTLLYPQGWVVEKGSILLDPAITIRPDIGTSSARGPWSHHERATHVSLYPQGVAREGLFGETRPSATIITLPRAVARDYILENGRVWGTLVTFEEHPKTWTDAGFVFARALVEEEEIVCLRAGTTVEEGSCDPLLGDSLVRNGFVDAEVLKTLELILTSIAFVTEDQAATQKPPEASGIRVFEPAPETRITSPLTVSGDVDSSWPSGNAIAVRLTDSAGNPLVSMVTEPKNARDGRVPFSVTLVFDPGTATSGVLMLGPESSLQAGTQHPTVEMPLSF